MSARLIRRKKWKIMSLSEFDFESSRQLFCEAVHESVDAQNLTGVKDAFSACIGSEADKKSSVDQAFRDVLLHLVRKSESPAVFTNVLSVAADAAQNDMCSTSTLFLLLSDLFDTISLDDCEEVFSFVEQRVSLWKLELFYNAGKNYLLRMCNDLLRRLSKSQNTVFCGRIQLFLARLFPLEEKSGLNLMSQFNLDNVTAYYTKPDELDPSALKPKASDEKDSNMDIEDGEMDEGSGTSGIPVDYNLYRKFWSLQDFFRRPAQCYEKFAWKTFSSYSDEVLSCFDSYRLDDVKVSQRKLEQQQVSQQSYFAKYLTSEKLLDLQLSDSNFRRCILLQYLILFHYLNAQVRFKTASQTLSDDQAAWVKQTTERVLKILRETPPDGELFTDTVTHMLSREDNWNSWKNDSCPNFIRKSDDTKPRAPAAPMGKKRSMGEELLSSDSKVINMGNPELTRLWNLCPDNMAACLSDKRNYTPSLEEYFETAIEQSDPAGGIEEQYKVINNPTYGWKALRLLSRKSPYFFGPIPSGSTQTYKKVPQYLELIVGKMAKDLPSTPTHETKTSDTVETSAADDAIDNTKDDDNSPAEESPSAPADEDTAEPGLDDAVVTAAADSQRVTTEVIERLATLVTDSWVKLATRLKFEQDDIIYFETENSTPTARASQMLTVWAENEGAKATLKTLSQALIGCGLKTVADTLVS